MIKKLYKKGLSTLLTLCLLFSFLPVMPVQAASYDADNLNVGDSISGRDVISNEWKVDSKNGGYGYNFGLVLASYPVTVEGGTADKAAYAVGETVTITADVLAGGQFANWSTENKDVTFTNDKAATTTFIMPAGEVTVKANFTSTPVPPATKYPVTVEGGTADKAAYAAGETVKITAQDELAGGRFDNWSTDSKDVTFADTKAATTTFTMPASAVMVKANFKTAPVPPAAEYTVTVTNDGNGTAKAAPDKAQAGTKITLSATPKSGYHFKEWKVEKGGVTIAKDNTFTMPAGDVTVKAVFEKTTTNPITGLPMSGGETGAFALITLSVLLLGITVLKRKADR